MMLSEIASNLNWMGTGKCWAHTIDRKSVIIKER
jgi:hypothetical protein